MVFFGHMYTHHFDVVPYVFHYGWAGVDVFFALSGFLFTIQYADALIAGEFSWQKYLKRRLFRIYPVTTLVVLIAAAARWWLFDWRNVLLHVTLLHGWVPWYRMRLNAPMWSLTVEESYYVLAPLLILYLVLFWRDCEKRWLAHASVTQRVLVYCGIALALWFMCLSWSRGAVSLYNDLLCWSTGLWDESAATHTIFGRLADFVAGMLAAVIARSIRVREQYGDVFVLLGTLLFVWTATWVQWNGGPDLVGNHKVGSIMLRVFALASAIGIYGLYCGGLISRLLSTRAAVFLGEISFTFYLIQYLSIFGAVKAAVDLQHSLEDLGLHFVLASFIGYLIMNIGSALIFLRFEKPLGRYLRARFNA